MPPMPRPTSHRLLPTLSASLLAPWLASPAYSLDLAEGTVLSGRWWNQGGQAGRWRPNAVVLADGGGYLSLQTDPDDLTIGWLER